MQRSIIFVVAIGVALSMTGCMTAQQGGPMPKSFSHIHAAGWASIEVRDELDYDKAWSTVINILVRNFDIERMSKNEGYIRTGWLHSWSGAYQANYRVRVTAKFSDDRHKVEIKPEAQYLVGVNWRMGVDSQLVSTLNSDLMGTLSRTVR